VILDHKDRKDHREKLGRKDHREKLGRKDHREKLGRKDHKDQPVQTEQVLKLLEVLIILQN
jgi:hypothetical protein